MHINTLMVIAVICAYIVKGMCGFANTLVFTSILSFRDASVNITPVDLLLGIPSNFLQAVKERNTVKLQKWGPPSAMLLVGSIPGIFLLKFGDVSFIKLVLGLTIAGIGIEMLVREKYAINKKATPAMLLLIGLISGFLCGLFGIGALMAAYMGRTTNTSAEFRGNLSIVFLMNNLFRLVVYSATGIMTWNFVWTAIQLIPFMLVGLYTGMLLSKFVNEKAAKTIIILMLIVSGAALFLTNLP